MSSDKICDTAGVTVLYSRILAKRPMVKINGCVQYLSTGTSMVHAGGKVVELFENTWMRACGVGSLDEDGSRKINKMGNMDLLLDVVEEREEFDCAVINTIRTALPGFSKKSLESFYTELMQITGEDDVIVRRGVSSSLGKIAPEDILLSGALSKDSPFFNKTTIGKEIRKKGIENYGIIEILEEIDSNTMPVTVDYPKASDPDFDNLNDEHLPNNHLSPNILFSNENSISEPTDSCFSGITLQLLGLFAGAVGITALAVGLTILSGGAMGAFLGVGAVAILLGIGLFETGTYENCKSISQNEFGSLETSSLI